MTNSRYPGSNFTAEYPYNQATISRSGHEVHVNDTPGSESIRIAHRKGTFAEIDSTGRLDLVVVGKTYYYLQDSLTETVDGHKDVKISGSLNVNADNSINMQTAGDWTEGAGGNKTIGVAGSYTLITAFDKSEAIGWDRTSKVQMNDTENVGLAKVTSSMKRTDVVGTVHTMSSGESTEIMSGGVLRLAATQIILEADTIQLISKSGPISVTSASTVALEAAGAISTTAGGAVNITSGGITTITSAGLTTINTPLGLLVSAGSSAINLNGSPVRANGRNILTV